jgi:hypothetical protein
MMVVTIAQRAKWENKNLFRVLEPKTHARCANERRSRSAPD